MTSLDRFRLLKEIGKGGQGVVYLAEDTIFGGKVAIKVLHASTTSDASFFRGLLMEEARLQATICPANNPHPNIVYIMDVRPMDDDICIVMEFVDGGSVEDLQRANSPQRTLSVSSVLEISLQVCEGLSAAHERTVIHRDIKPRNILIRRSDKVVKIADWGVAKNIGIAGPGHTFTGTLPYMSPEVIRLNDIIDRSERQKGSGVDHRTDIYSLGVMIFEMLCGSFPFRDRNDVLRGATARQERILLDKGVDKSLAPIILKAIARDPNDRFQTAREQREALKAWQSTHLLAGDLQEAWELFRNNHDTVEAEKKFLYILARYQSSPQAYLELGRFYIQCSREDNAIKVLSNGIDIAPEFAQLWNARGRLYAKRNSPHAVSDLTHALELDLPKKDKEQIRTMLKRLATI